uniref:Uncharacterized protein n=1 Tax=Arundo donax TaxID=35708 RepID=A0A0A9H3G9_ARUDO
MILLFSSFFIFLHY